jgi:hypothetical protein
MRCRLPGIERRPGHLPSITVRIEIMQVFKLAQFQVRFKSVLIDFAAAH